MEAKPFSIGFRIEHPQSLIDRARFGPSAGHPILGAADYKLVHHASNGRSVYSFCMCPGGTVVAATSEPGRVVTNGMSQYSRNERNANAGIVVGITPQDYRQDGAAGGPVTRWTASPSSATGSRAPLSSAAAATWRRRSWSATSSRASAPARSAACCLRTSRACSSPIWRSRAAALPDYAHRRRSARRCPRSTGRSRASPCPTPCSPASRRAPRRRCASRAATTAEPQRARACTRPARARATRAASCRPASTASRWPKRWRADMLGLAAA